MRARDRRINSGGLMRCCLATIRESVHDTEVGDTLKCDYCPHQMIVGVDGTWKWLREEVKRIGRHEKEPSRWERFRQWYMEYVVCGIRYRGSHKWVRSEKEGECDRCARCKAYDDAWFIGQPWNRPTRDPSGDTTPDWW